MAETSREKWTNPPQSIHKALARWAPWCAERALYVFEERRPGDDRPRAAIESVQAWERSEVPMTAVALLRSRRTRRHARRWRRAHLMPSRPHARLGRQRPSPTCSTIRRTRPRTRRKRSGSTVPGRLTAWLSAPGSGSAWTLSCEGWVSRTAGNHLPPLRTPRQHVGRAPPTHECAVDAVQPSRVTFDVGGRDNPGVSSPHRWLAGRWHGQLCPCTRVLMCGKRSAG